MRCILMALSLLVSLTAFGAQAADLTIATEGNCDYQIVLPDRPPTPSISNCLGQVARLMQTAFSVNGFSLPVVAESQRDPAKPTLYLGNTAFARTHGVDFAKIQGWGYAHKVVGRDVIVAGRDEPSPGKVANRGAPASDRLGTAKAVADFLRLYAGTRFLYPDAGPWNGIASAAKLDFLTSPAIEFLPTPTIAVPADLDVAQTLPIKYSIAWASSAGFYDIANNRFPIVDEIFGGHTYGRAIPLDKYRETNPEYFALIGGKRLVEPGGMAQYCISNPEVQELLYQDLIRWLDAGYETVDLGQQDGFRACQCENCQKLFDTGSDWNEKLWILHRNLAERVLKSHPDKQVTIASYIQTALPPKTFKKFPKNVRIMLTGTNDDDIEPWRQCEVPGGFTAYIYNWCANLVTRYTPMKTPRFVEEQAKRFVENDFQAIYRDGPGALFGLEAPVYYVMGRMYDDAMNLQAKDLMYEFCGAAFGKSSGAMLRFYDRLYHGIELYSEYLGTRCPGWSYIDIYGRSHKYLTDPFQLLGFLYTPDLIEAMEKDLAQAEQSADTGKIAARLMLVRREFDYLKHLSNVVNLYHAYQVSPDLNSRDRLLDELDARNAFIDRLFDTAGLKQLTDAGWTYTMFPIPGHNAAHLRLAHDGYQEPMKNTCFNWDTKAMRAAPPPGTKRLELPPVAAALRLDSPEWENVAPVALSALPFDAELTQQTDLRAIYDTSAVLLRIDSGVSATEAASIPPEELVTVYLTPPAGKEISYRFTAGLNPESRSEAASGFVTDVMDPRYNEYDPDWNGDWTVATRFDPDKHRWSALFRIPFTTLGVEPPAVGTAWRANVGRIHIAAEGRVEQSLWSVTPNTKDMDDRSVFGEFAFEAEGAGGPKKNPLQAWREEYNGQTAEMPAAWQMLPDPLPQPLGPWMFRTDPLARGTQDRWDKPELSETDWVPALVPAFWAEIEGVGNYQGDGWYRVTFTVPAGWKGRAVEIRFAGVDEQAWVYVNGKLVKEHSTDSEGKTINDLWEAPFAATVPPDDLNYGQTNVLAVRVNNSLANGGIWRPVLIHAAPDKK